MLFITYEAGKLQQRLIRAAEKGTQTKASNVFMYISKGRGNLIGGTAIFSSG